MEVVISEPAASEDIRRVHTQDYLDFLGTAHARWCAIADHSVDILPNAHPTREMLECGARLPVSIVGQAGWYISDASCSIGKGTWQASVAAAGAAVAAADEVATGMSAYALTRPPGHHAYPAKTGGHCYLNNSAIAVERLRAKGASRVAILDIDSHHGNGTQGIFWSRNDVLFVSVHGNPNNCYPWFVGHADERGAGTGENFNLNLPLPLGSGDSAWLDAIDAGLSRIRRFNPDAMVLSLGFDAYKDEPLFALAVTEDGFSRAGEKVGSLRLPTAVVQEGGYNIDALGLLLTRFISGFGA